MDHVAVSSKHADGSLVNCSWLDSEVFKRHSMRADLVTKVVLGKKSKLLFVPIIVARILE